MAMKQELAAPDRGLVIRPVATAEAILSEINIERTKRRHGEAHTRQCNWWKTANVERVGAIVGWTKNPPSAGKMSRHARLV